MITRAGWMSGSPLLSLAGPAIGADAGQGASTGSSDHRSIVAAMIGGVTGLGALLALRHAPTVARLSIPALLGAATFLAANALLPTPHLHQHGDPADQFPPPGQDPTRPVTEG